MAVIFASRPASKKITGQPGGLEAIIHTVDTIKSDLNKCGMRLQVCRGFIGISPFTSSARSLTSIYGIAEGPLLGKGIKGQQSLKIVANEFFKSGKGVLIYDLANQAWDMNEIGSMDPEALVLNQPLQNDYPINSMVVALKKVEYKYNPTQRVLKRRTDKGIFQPLMEDVSDFYATFFSDANSVLYRIEVNKKEQIMG